MPRINANQNDQFAQLLLEIVRQLHADLTQESSEAGAKG
jgi:hypothetical protein